MTGRTISKIGRISGVQAKESIDAEGHVVTPGFVDGHTHMDAQIFWDQLGSSSCYHGVTTVVMGNCGFTLAPCREAEADLVFRNLERAEDISRSAMLERHRLAVGDLSGISGCYRQPSKGNKLCWLCRSLGNTNLCNG